MKELVSVVAPAVNDSVREFITAQERLLRAQFAADCRARGDARTAEIFHLVDLEQLEVHGTLLRSRMWAGKANAFLARAQSLCRWMSSETLAEFRHAPAGAPLGRAA